MNLGFQWALGRLLCYSTDALLKSSMKLTPAPGPPQLPAASVLCFLRVINGKLDVIEGFRSLQDCFGYSCAMKLKSSLGKATKTLARLSQPTQSFVFWSSWCHSQYLCAAETHGNGVAVKVSFGTDKLQIVLSQGCCWGWAVANRMVILTILSWASVNGVEEFLFNGCVKHGINLILALSFKIISDTNDLPANETLGLP